MKKRLLSVLLAVAVVMGSFTAPVNAKTIDVNNVQHAFDTKVKAVEDDFEPLYLDSSTQYGYTGKTNYLTFKSVTTNLVVGLIYANAPSETTLNVSSNDAQSYNKTFSVSDWEYDAADQLYCLPFFVTPYANNATINVDFTFSTNCAYMTVVMQDKTGTLTPDSGYGDETGKDDDYEEVVETVSDAKITSDHLYIVDSTTQSNVFEALITDKENGTLYTEGYEYKIVNASTKKKAASGTTSSYGYIEKKLSKRAKYYVQVRAYAHDSNNNKVYGKWSSKYYCISNPSIKKSATKNSIKSNSINIQWNKVAGASKYEVYYSADGNKFKKIKTVSSTNYKVTKVNGKSLVLRNSRKYFKVVAIGKGSSKNVKSTGTGFSAIQNVTYHYRY